MTERLYYENSFLFNFSAVARELRALADGRSALLLDSTAFYPGGGGQPSDSGWIEFLPAEGEGSTAEAVEDEATGEILHLVDRLPAGVATRLSTRLCAPGEPPLRVRGFVDAERRQDHMQQHSGQHLLSAAFRKLCGAPTLAFRLGEELSTIELDIASLSASQIEQAERLANQFVWEDRQVLMHEVSAEQARKLGVPVADDPARPTRRLVEFRGVDLSVCGGTHVKATGQIGNIQLRRWKSTERGTSVEFVCGGRALGMARADFTALSQTPQASNPTRVAQPKGSPADESRAPGEPTR
jgi:alanyl-tRNA synthetase